MTIEQLARDNHEQSRRQRRYFSNGKRRPSWINLSPLAQQTWQTAALKDQQQQSKRG